jgi:hypothetical protein
MARVARGVHPPLVFGCVCICAPANLHREFQVREKESEKSMRTGRFRESNSLAYGVLYVCTIAKTGWCLVDGDREHSTLQYGFITTL